MAPGAAGITALTNDVTTPGAGSGVATIANGVVTFAKIQNVNGNTLVGRAPGSPGAAQELSVGGGLGIAGGILSVGNLDAAHITTGLLNVSVGGTGSTSFAPNSLIMSNGSGTALTNLSCALNQTLQYNGSVWACVAMPTGGLALDGSQSMTGAIKAAVGGTDQYNPGYGFSGAAGNGMFYTGSNVLAFATDSTERMRISDTGRIGIGITVPQAPLHVKALGASANMMLENSSGGSALQFVNSSYAGMRVNYSIAGGGLEFGTVTGGSNDPAAMVLKNSGKLGIGMTSPVANLDVMGPGGGQPVIRGTIQNTGVANIMMEGFGSGGTGYGAFVGRGANGSAGSPGQVQGGYKIASFGGSGYTDASNFSGTSGGMAVIAEGSFTSASWPTGVGFFVTPNGSTSGSEVMRVDSSGNVGIGTTNPSYKLDVMGDINMNIGNALRVGGTQICTSSGCTAVSDIRYKKNIRGLASSLDKVTQLQGVEYDWKDKSRFGDQHQVGFIAQELEKVYPEVVQTDKKTGYKSVAYGNLVAPIVEAIKELYAKFLAQDEELSRLKQENAMIKAYLCAKDASASICQ